MNVSNITKSLTVVSLLIGMSEVALAGSAVKPGKYLGQGSWKDQQGHSGHYNVTTMVLTDSFASMYKFPEGARDFDFKLVAKRDGYYELQQNGSSIGTMYCGDVQCHLDFPKAEVEETVTFYQGHLYKIGSKPDGEGGRLMWQENLEIYE